MLDKLDQLKKFIKSNQSELILMLGVILISLISFASGRLTAPSLEKQPITVEDVNVAHLQSSFQNITSTSSLQVLKQKTQGKFVASKNSNKYHLPECIGAKRIADHNKIWFSSKEEAESLGYQPASTCPGL